LLGEEPRDAARAAAVIYVDVRQNDLYLPTIGYLGDRFGDTLCHGGGTGLYNCYCMLITIDYIDADILGAEAPGCSVQDV